jgi:hypothetical protein
LAAGAEGPSPPSQTVKFIGRSSVVDYAVITLAGVVDTLVTLAGVVDTLVTLAGVVDTLVTVKCPAVVTIVIGALVYHVCVIRCEGSG